MYIVGVKEGGRIHFIADRTDGKFVQPCSSRRRSGCEVVGTVVGGWLVGRREPRESVENVLRAAA